MSDNELRAWADAHTRGAMLSSVAVAVLKLFERLEAQDRLILGQSERIAAQSAILSRKAEKPNV